MTILQSLKSLSNYPIPTTTIQNIVEGLGFDVADDVTQELRKSKNFKRAQAQMYLFLAEAPNVSQGGISYSFSDDERKRFRLRADNLLDEVGDDNNTGVQYGYMGSDL